MVTPKARTILGTRSSLHDSRARIPKGWCIRPSPASASPVDDLARAPAGHRWRRAGWCLSNPDGQLRYADVGQQMAKLLAGHGKLGDVADRRRTKAEGRRGQQHRRTGTARGTRSTAVATGTTAGC